ncbi:MAG: hypothetical protein H2065_01630 [Candidatus Poseidoniales archaeon]|nr:hypothetical protein [Candidatus Poseidoniales archaeon]
MVLLMMLMLVPLTPVSTAADTNPGNLQAQHIAAVFDPVSETTTVSWQNIDTYNGNVPYYHSAMYNVHRHTEPITPSNIDATQLVESVVACEANVYIQYAWCLSSAGGNGGQHPGHSVSYLVDAGTNSTYYYAVTIEWDSDGDIVGSTGWALDVLYQELDPDVSSITIGVEEVTSPVETPLFFRAEYSLTDSETTLDWINYHDLPNSEPAMENTSILIWRSTAEISRSNGGLVYQGLTVATIIANISSDSDSYVHTVPPNTNEEAYYAITYFIPNKTGPGEDFVDLRFLSGNALTQPILEDNRPPDHVSVFSVSTSSESDGTGETQLTWFSVPGEQDERYDLYVSGTPFSSIYNTGVTFLASVYDNQELEDSNNPYTYTRDLPIGTLGWAHYCVVTVDAIGLFDENTSSSSCDSVEEDAFSNWQKEPTNVYAEFIGDRTVRVTWVDQLGVEGERYHIYSTSGVPTNPQQFATQTDYHGFVNDNTQVFDIVIGPEVVSPNGAPLNWYIYVTSEAQYIHANGSYEYLGLNQNSYGPVEIDITYPTRPQIVTAESRGDLGFVAMEWSNLQEPNETYQIWRHNGDPFDDSSLSSSDAEGWELVLDDVNVGLQNSATIIRNIPIENGTEQDAFYGLTVCDQFMNCNPELLDGLTSNTRLIREDTRAPSIDMELIDDDDGVPYTSPSLIPGLYTVKIEVSETLKTTPSIEVFSLAGYNETAGGALMTQTADNALNPDKGPEYSFDFRITASETASDLIIRMTLLDQADNVGVITNTSFKIDAKSPTIAVYAPSPSSEGSKYLYGNKINLMFAAEDDVQIAELQYRFTFNFGGLTGVTGTSPWANAEGITDVNNDGTSLVSDMEFSAGTFDAGQHAITVRALDTAGNQKTAQVVFVVDFCRNNLEGETICTFEEDLKPEPEPEIVTPSMSEPPYVLVWIAVIVNVVIFVVALMIVQVSLSGPKKKKKSGDEDEDDDWMSEFIGTTQDLDMDSITGTGSAAEEKKEDEPKSESSEPVEEEDDPFAVNLVQRKTRRKKKAEEEEDDDDDDDDDLSWAGLDDDGDDDDDDDDDDEEEEQKPRKRPVRKRPARKAAPSRKRPVRRKKSDD